MKKISIALLVSLSAVAGIASAQTSSDGIVMTHDSNLAAQIEQHARDVQAQPAVQQDDEAVAGKAEQKPAHHHQKKTAAKSQKAHTASK